MAIGSAYAHAFYHADAMGNITAMINAAGTLVAKYLYDPFGRILSQIGSLAEDNLYRFSSKEFHVLSGVVYYLYRFYDPSLQRWLNTDPVTETGFMLTTGIATSLTPESWAQQSMEDQTESPNRYEFAENAPMSNVDPYGLEEKTPPVSITPPVSKTPPVKMVPVLPLFPAGGQGKGSGIQGKVGSGGIGGGLSCGGQDTKYPAAGLGDPTDPANLPWGKRHDWSVGPRLPGDPAR
jgi:RHS repeat-associated protein